MNLKLIKTLLILIWAFAIGSIVWFAGLGIVAIVTLFRPA